MKQKRTKDELNDMLEQAYYEMREACSEMDCRECVLHGVCKTMLPLFDESPEYWRDL